MGDDRGRDPLRQDRHHGRGRMRCIGDPLHLKNRFGKGYALQLLLTRKVADDPEAIAELDKFISSDVSFAASVEAASGTARTYRLATEDVSLSDVFNAMEASKDSLGVREWALSQSTMEDVFATVCLKAEAEAETKT